MSGWAKLNAYEIISNVHRIGSPIKGVVTNREDWGFRDGVPCGQLTLATSSQYPATIHYHYLVDDRSTLTLEMIPDVGDEIIAVVFNCVDNVLRLSAKPHDLEESTIREWNEFYKYVDTLEFGETHTGRVTWVPRFGVFVDLGSSYDGLIDIVSGDFEGCKQLPHDYSTWPKVGDLINYRITHIRYLNRQIGLGWCPE